jgi:hypothetical protein
MTVRLLGIRTPETSGEKSKTKSHPDWRRFITGFLLNEEVRLEFDHGIPAKDRSGRLLAYVYRTSDESLLNKELLSNGYAFTENTQSYSMLDDFLEVEANARGKRIGMWKQTAEKGAEPKKATRSLPADPNELRASSWLNTALKFETSEPAVCMSRLRKVIDSYPNTAAAKTAREKLDEFEKSKKKSKNSGAANPDE